MTDEQPKNSYGQSWDEFVDNAKGEGQTWPGDDWGNPALWDAWFARLFTPHGVADWQRAVEIGQGTGKYTARVLEAGCREILAVDVSRRFIELCGKRQKASVDANRLHLQQIHELDPRALQQAVEKKGWTGTVDAMFSIDTLVHLTWTQIVAYMLAATEFLRPDGWLIFSFAHGATEPGLRKMIADIDRTITAGGDPTTGCFHWVSPELVAHTANYCGYEVRICDADPEHHRDGHFVGRFHDPERAVRARELREGP